MAVPVINFTTGPSTLPDIGELSYNGCIFSPLFETNINGTCVKDNANRTTKYMEYVITVDGYASIRGNNASISNIMDQLRSMLTAQGGALTYRGRGFDLVVGPETLLKDVAWGPVPELLDFQPLGAGKSAKVVWKVTVRIPEIARTNTISAELLQFNYDTAVTYGEDWYSALSISGTMEIPLRRTPRQGSRNVSLTVDDLRSELDRRIFVGLDMSRFRVTQREYEVSRDKRTMEFRVAVEEKPYMDLPTDCTIARGTYSVRPARSGMGLCNWLCTLRATYTVRRDKPRRLAWFAFLALLRVRMSESGLGNIPQLANGNQNPNDRSLASAPLRGIQAVGNPIGFWTSMLGRQNQKVNNTTRPFLLDFSFEEGLYLDSKTVTFSATWRLVTTMSHILLASGLWKKFPERDETGLNIWASSVVDVSGSRSWLTNPVDARLDVIVDFGGP